MGLYAVGASRASAAGAGQAVEGPRGSLAGWWEVVCVFLVGVSFSLFKVADCYLVGGILCSRASELEGAVYRR